MSLTEQAADEIERAGAEYYAAERRAGADPSRAYQLTDEFKKRLLQIAERKRP